MENLSKVIVSRTLLKDGVKQDFFWDAMTYIVNAPGGHKYRGMLVGFEPYGDFVRIRVAEESKRKKKKLVWEYIKEKDQYDYLCRYQDIEEYEEEDYV